MRQLTAALLDRLHELRGWTPEAIERLGVSFDGERVCFPVRDATGDLIGWTRYQPNGDRLREGETKMRADRGTSRELFPPPEMIGDDEHGGVLWLGEGEADTVRLWSLGLAAVGVPGTQGWNGEWAARFSGRRWRVVVCFDCDQPGRDSAREVVRSLVAEGVDARILDLDPARDDGHDLSDYFAKARTESDREEARRILERCAETVPVFTSPASPQDEPSPSAETPGVPRSHTWHPQDLLTLGSERPTPPDIGGLVYAGKRHVLSGEDDAGKTMLLVGISADELRAERGVVWIDTDDMGASALLERLRGFGSDDATIRRLFAYLRPEEALTDAARDDVIALIRDRGVRLVVVDAFNASLALHGYSPKATEEVEAFWQRCVAPFTRVGAGVVLPDHVVKDTKERGRYAYGSERKATGCDLHLGMRVVEPFGRGRRGKAKLTVHRDRVGFLPKPSPGVFVLDSDADTGRLAWRIEPPQAVDEGDFRPTRLMEKVSDYVQRFGDACSRKQIEQDVKGKTDFKRQAIDLLVREGYLAETSGDRGARLVEHVRPFHEADEWADS